MEVKVGQVWFNNINESTAEVLEDIGDGMVSVNCRQGICTTSKSHLKNFYHLRKPPSDLEIVQKALAKVEGYLECSNSYSEVRDSFGKTLFDGCHNELLTWATETIKQ